MESQTKSRTAFYLTNANHEYLKQASKELGISMSFYLNLMLQNEQQQNN